MANRQPVSRYQADRPAVQRYLTTSDGENESMKFTKKPDATIYEAEQYLGPNARPYPKGICGDADCGMGMDNVDHVHTAHNWQPVKLEIGDWIMPEPDGRGYYPIKSDIFEDRYERV